jgi:hypothetical protein
MQLRIVQFVVFPLLAFAAVAGAQAQPGAMRHAGRMEMPSPAYYARSNAVPPTPPLAEQAPPIPERIRQHQFAFPYSGAYESRSDGNHPQERMTLEERRALRQQIDEVGHELYGTGR